MFNLDWKESPLFRYFKIVTLLYVCLIDCFIAVYFNVNCIYTNSFNLSVNFTNVQSNSLWSMFDIISHHIHFSTTLLLFSLAGKTYHLSFQSNISFISQISTSFQLSLFSSPCSFPFGGISKFYMVFLFYLPNSFHWFHPIFDLSSSKSCWVPYASGTSFYIPGTSFHWTIWIIGVSWRIHSGCRRTGNLWREVGRRLDG